MSAPQQTTPHLPASPTQLHAAELSSPAPDTAEPGSVGAGSTVLGNSNSNSAATNPQAPIGLGLQLTTALSKAETEVSWGAPAGLHMRRPNDENLAIFRRAVGINSGISSSNNNNINSSTLNSTTATDPASLEAGRRTAGRGIYAAAQGEVHRKKLLFHLLSFVINASHVSQIVIGASLTAL